MERGVVRTLGLASLGAVLEYFDFIVYIYVTPVLSAAFFPPEMPDWLRQIQILSIYALGYLIRPLAGIVVGHFGDRLGRKKLFMFTIVLMAIPTFLMGFLPTFQQVGWIAPGLLLLLRLAQGCALGGELPGAVIFVVEHAPRNRIGLFGTTIFGVINMGLFLGIGAAAIANAIAARDPGLASLAWRLPFLVGGVFGLVAAYLRRQLQETPLFLSLKETRRLSAEMPLKQVVRNHLPAIWFVLGLTFLLAQTGAGYFQYMPTLLTTQYAFPKDQVFAASMWGTALYAMTMPVWGWISDRVGWGKALLLGAVLTALGAVWFFAEALPQVAAGHMSLTTAWLVIAFPSGSIGLTGVLVASLFPTEIRYSGFSFAYNIGVAVFAGLTPLMLGWLVQVFDRTAPMYTISAGALVMAVLAACCGGMRFYLTRPVDEALDLRSLFRGRRERIG